MVQDAAEKEAAKNEILRSALASASETIKACLWINAGSAAALVGIISQLIGKGEYNPVANALIPSVKWFVWGAVTAIVGHAVSYFANLAFAGSAWLSQKAGGWFRIGAIALVLCSIGFFSLGACNATRSLSEVNKSQLPKRAPAIQEVK
jgi:Na+-driven multidrug efflux pump